MNFCFVFPLFTKMLVKAELPLKTSLHSMLDDGSGLEDIPFLFSIAVEPVTDSNAATHSSQLHIPLMATVASLEVNCIMLKAPQGADSRKVYLFMQRLDFSGAARGPPVPIAITDTAQSSVSVRFKLQAGDHIRLLLIQRGTGAGVREIAFNGFLLQSTNSFFLSSAPPAVLATWTPDPLAIVEGERLVEARKRSRSSERQQSVVDEVGDEIPTLIYAPVDGGDDES